MNSATSATAQLVPEHDRMAFLPKHFGQRLMLRGEIATYSWLDRLSQDYRGVYWRYYEVPGSFYLAPAGYGGTCVLHVQALDGLAPSMRAFM